MPTLMLRQAQPLSSLPRPNARSTVFGGAYRNRTGVIRVAAGPLCLSGKSPLDSCCSSRLVDFAPVAVTVSLAGLLVAPVLAILLTLLSVNHECPFRGTICPLGRSPSVLERLSLRHFHGNLLCCMVALAGLEPALYGLSDHFLCLWNTEPLLVRQERFELSTPAWHAGVLPLLLLSHWRERKESNPLATVLETAPTPRLGPVGGSPQIRTETVRGLRPVSLPVGVQSH